MRGRSTDFEYGAVFLNTGPSVLLRNHNRGRPWAAILRLFRVTAGGVFPGPGVVFSKAEVALVADLRDQAVFDGQFDATVVFVSMSTVLESAVANERAELDVVAIDFFQ